MWVTGDKYKINKRKPDTDLQSIINCINILFIYLSIVTVYTIQFNIGLSHVYILCIYLYLFLLCLGFIPM